LFKFNPDANTDALAITNTITSADTGLQWHPERRPRRATRQCARY
jgi:hypothetical protein